MRTYEVLADALHACGGRAVFTIMGDGNKDWLVAVARRGVRLFHVRHEGAGLAMADGYARATGGVGLCSVTYSAGLTQLCTSLMVAARHRSPVLVVAGELPSAQRGYASSIDLDSQTLIRASGAIPLPVRSARTAYEDMEIAFDLARSQRRPVVLLAPVDIQAEIGTGDGCVRAEDGVRRQKAQHSTTRAAAPQESVQRAAAVLCASERPLIVAGRGAVASGARDAIRELAARIGGLVATTLHAKGYLDLDPGNVGILGSFSDWRARRLICQTDCVLAVGAGLNAYTAALGELFPDAKVIQLDSRAEGPELTPYDLVTRGGIDPIPVTGDAQTVLNQLLASVPAAERPWRADNTVAALLATDPRRESIESKPASLATGTMDPRELMIEMDAALPDDCTVVIGVGNFTWFPLQFLRNPGAREFFSTLDFVAIGQAVPIAIGAAVSGTDRQVVAIEGDASFMMHVQELETAARYGAPVLVFVLNDGALGAEYHKLEAAGVDSAESIMPTADICEVAQSLGCRAMRITRPEQLAEVLDWYDPRQGPHVVDCPTSRSVVGPA